jgi:hypothetical protein
MPPRTRRTALYAIGIIAILASADALAHSYAGLYGWAVHHRLGGWQAWSWPAEIDVFVVIGELALYVAYLDAWPARQRLWPWMTAVLGLVVSVAGNVGARPAAAGRAGNARRQGHLGHQLALRLRRPDNRAAGTQDEPSPGGSPVAIPGSGRASVRERGRRDSAHRRARRNSDSTFSLRTAVRNGVAGRRGRNLSGSSRGRRP